MLYCNGHKNLSKTWIRRVASVLVFALFVFALLKIVENRNEIRHVVLLKVAKTGSSTVQNIFMRFAESRQLSVALPHSNHLLRKSCCEHVISFNNSLTDQNIVPPSSKILHDTLNCHVIYNRNQMQNYFYSDTVYIGIVREPIKRLESAINYFDMYVNENLTNVAKNPFKYNKNVHMMSTNNLWKYPIANMSNNRMAFEFGFPNYLFPTSIASYKNNAAKMAAVKEYIQQLDQDFMLILLTERIDEGLVLMKRLLHWSLRDILYKKSMVANKHNYRRFASRDITNLRSYLYLDNALYEFAVNKFNKQIAEQGPDFQNEVVHFRRVNDKIRRFCEDTLDRLFISKSRWNYSFEMLDLDCQLLETDELTYVGRTRLRLYGTLAN